MIQCRFCLLTKPFSDFRKRARNAYVIKECHLCLKFYNHIYHKSVRHLVVAKRAARYAINRVAIAERQKLVMRARREKQRKARTAASLVLVDTDAVSLGKPSAFSGRRPF